MQLSVCVQACLGMCHIWCISLKRWACRNHSHPRLPRRLIHFKKCPLHFPSSPCRFLTHAYTPPRPHTQAHTLLAIQRGLLQHQQLAHLGLQRLINLNLRCTDKLRMSRRRRREKVAGRDERKQRRIIMWTG